MNAASEALQSVSSPFEYDCREYGVLYSVRLIAEALAARSDEIANSAGEVCVGTLKSVPSQEYRRSHQLSCGKLSAELEMRKELLERGIALVRRREGIYESDPDIISAGGSALDEFALLIKRCLPIKDFQPRPITQAFVLRDDVSYGLLDHLLTFHFLQGGEIPDYLQSRVQHPPRDIRLMAQNVKLSPEQLRRLNTLVFPNLARRIIEGVREQFGEVLSALRGY